MIKDDYTDFLASPIGKELCLAIQDEINILANQVHIAAEKGISEDQREHLNQIAHTLRVLRVFKEKLLSGDLFHLN